MEMMHIREKSDVIHARERGRDIAKSVGFSLVDQTIIAYTISELALKLISFAEKGHMTIRQLCYCKGEQASGIEVRLFDHFRGPSRIQQQWIDKLAADLELTHDQLRGTMITFRKWTHSEVSEVRYSSPNCAAGEE
ncbi:serine/threonine-protein kinase RsbT [Paenibacillus taihuensis]|uniref:Serine/threonine-protein kinase RsbT n=1 Tax=Paenibacillus taihuensis TaxID=1156355 RepID=A0A3D9S4Q5_9BACL|nr:hypothetical protein [Paenibacillus taihuensis]REE85181.1 serine/threonine-protein kinase RsbT [Paenibacillus taihuensis]